MCLNRQRRYRGINAHNGTDSARYVLYVDTQVCRCYKHIGSARTVSQSREMFTITRLYRDNGGFPLSVTLRMK